MKLTFENEVGKVILGSNQRFKITAINGLYIPSKNYGTINFANYDGQLTYSACANARIITIGGDIVSKNIRNELEWAMRVFNESGILIIDYGDKVRKIICNQVTFSVSNRTLYSAVFTLQFVCDYPYFTDVSPVSMGIYGSVGLITNPITLPCVLSQSGTTRDIVVNGHRKTFPVFNIKVKSKGTAIDGENYGYKIENRTTNQLIYLQYNSVAGEQIIIDVGKREITSSIEGSIITRLSKDTELENFYLVPGHNTIVVTDLGEDDNSMVDIEFENYYVEAVY